MIISDDGKEAITEYTVEKVWKKEEKKKNNGNYYSLLRIKLHTGR
jgi:23S rRNA-/tRNA-specific pseudouridylate synthase